MDLISVDYYTKGIITYTSKCTVHNKEVHDQSYHDLLCRINLLGFTSVIYKTNVNMPIIVS